MPAPIGAPTITFTVTAVIRREWTIVLPTSLVDQAAQALRKEARLSPYRRVHASCILDQIRTDGGEFAAGIPDLTSGMKWESNHSQSRIACSCKSRKHGTKITTTEEVQ